MSAHGFAFASIVALLALCAFAAWQQRAWRIAHERYVASIANERYASTDDRAVGDVAFPGRRMV